MKIYHTETQEDYDALMIDLEEQGCKWLSGRKPTEAKYDWFNYGEKTCVRRISSAGILTKFDLGYSKENYPSVPIIEYKAKVDEKMRIYHTETQEDYDALMVELEAEGCEWFSGRKPTEAPKNWKQSSSETCIKVDQKVIAFEEKRYYILRYPGVQIIKYKAKTEDKMKIYHTETQEDYDALMVELEEQGHKWSSGSEMRKIPNYWTSHKSEMCVMVDCCGYVTYGKKNYFELSYQGTPITKYKVKVDTSMKFTKENVLNLTDKWIQNKIDSFQDLQNEIKKLEDTSEKVVVPKCFDEWFKEIVVEYPMIDSAKRFALWKLSRKGFGYGFERANGKTIQIESELGTWLNENTFLAIDAVLNGYIVEPEQLYYIPLPHLELSDGTKQVLSKRDTYFASWPDEKMKQQFTKDELEQVPEIYRLFAKPI